MSSTRRHADCSRRQTLAGLASSLLAPAWAQLAPQAENKPAPMPQRGSLLPLPELVMLDGTRFAATAADGHVLTLYRWVS